MRSAFQFFRQAVEYQLKDVIAKAHEADSLGNIPVVVHATNIGGTEYGSYVNDFARWEDVNNDNSTWHDLLILYKASDTSGDGTGRFRGWVDGVLAWDISPDGISSGYATQAAVNAIATNHIYFLKFPDTLNTNTQAQNAVIDYDNLTWWKKNS